MVAPVEILVKANTKSLDGLGKALRNVEKQVGGLNKVKITLDTTQAEREVEKLADQLQRAEKFVDQFLGRTNAARRGVGAFNNDLASLKGQLSLVRKGFENTNDAIKRQERGVALLAGQYKNIMIEGRAFAQGAAGGQGFFGLFGGGDDAKLGIGSLQARLKELEKLPKSMAGTSQALREIRFLLDFAVDGSDEFLMLVRAQNNALDRQKKLYAEIARLTKLQAREQLMAAIPKAAPGTQYAGPIGPGPASLLSQAPAAKPSTAVSFPSASIKPKAAGRGAAAFNKSALGQAALGGGFPALFGAGPTSVLGGAIGGAVGGFAGGIVGSLIGQQVDAFVGAAAKFADSLRKPTENLDQIVQSIGRVNTELETNTSVLKALGLESVAAKAAFSDLTDLIGTQGVQDLEKLSDAWNNMLNLFSRLFVQISAATAGPLTKFFNIVAAITGGLTGGGTSETGRSEKIARLQSDYDALVAAGITGAPLSTAKVMLETAKEQQGARTPEGGKLDVEKIITEEYSRQLQLVEGATNVEQMRLTARRDTLAGAKEQLNIQKLTNELTKLDVALNGKLEESKRRQLEEQRKQTEEQRKAAEAAKANAVIEAQRAIRREQEQNLLQSLEIRKSINQERVKEIEFTEGINAGAKAELDLLAKNLFYDQEISHVRHNLAMLGKTEVEIQNSLIQKFGLEQVLRERAYSNEVLITRERQAQYNLAVAQAEQQRQLEIRQLEGQFALQAKQLSSFPIGPFAQGELSNQLRDMERQIELERQLQVIQDKKNNLSRVGADLSQKDRDALEKEIGHLEKLYSGYERNSAVLNNLIAFQERYRETLALTAPVTDALFDSIVAVAEGTKTARDAFADFLRSIADVLMSVAKQMISQYIALGIARMFAIPGSETGSSAIKAGAAVSQVTLGSFGGGRARGGPVSSNRPYLVGERGPELFVPGAQGNIVPNSGMGGANVVVNVDAGGSSVQGNAPDANRLGQAIGAAVRAELINQRRPGGLLA